MILKYRKKTFSSLKEFIEKEGLEDLYEYLYGNKKPTKTDIECIKEMLSVLNDMDYLIETDSKVITIYFIKTNKIDLKGSFND